MTTLPEPEPTDKCPGCQAAVLVVSSETGERKTVERVPAGQRGDVALTHSLFGGPPLASRGARSSAWRFHRCPTEVAFSAANFRGKRSGEVAGEVFRQLGAHGCSCTVYRGRSPYRRDDRSCPLHHPGGRP